MSLAKSLTALLLAIGFLACSSHPSAAQPEIVTYSAPGAAKTLRGLVYKPSGPGPFPTVLYNHGSAPGMLNTQAFDLLGPIFVAHGWAFFAPYRRGQGLSAEAGPYIGDEIAAARKRGGQVVAADEMVRLLSGDHLQDQVAAYEWLAQQSFAKSGRIAVMGNSFGGVETLLGAKRLTYCAAVDASGGAESWADAPPLRSLLTRTVVEINTPVLFFQAANDYDVAPSVSLSQAMTAAGKSAEIKLYPAFGASERDGHSFAYRGAAVWSADVLTFLDRNCS